MSNSFTFLSKYNKRNTSIEILRILFMLLILIGHVYAHGSNLDYQLIYSYAGHLDTFWHTSMFSLCKIGVTGFIFISGFYGIKFNLKKLLILFLHHCSIIFSYLRAQDSEIYFNRILVGGISILTYSFMHYLHL